MPAMDVSPKELLDNDIREAWRGYNREDVEALLEKAAATIEGLGEKVKQLSDRVKAAETDMSHGKETEDMLHRTLLLAQRTADEAVTEAQTRARQLLEDAENKSRALVTEAEANARRVSDDERTRLENEILDLASRREALTSDVDALQQYESEYRGRLQRALESDLEILKQQTAGPSVPRPQLSTVEIPVLAEGFARPAPVVEEPVAEEPVFEEPVVEEPAAEEPAVEEPAVEEPAVEEPAVEEPAVEEPAAENPEVDNEAEPEPAAASSGDEPSGDTGVDLTGAGDADKLEAYVPAAKTAEPANADAGNGVAAAEGVEAVEGKMLDDDAFFASLREAVRDDAPLGPRDDEAAEPGFFDQDEAEATNRKLFKRRR
jgi:cell division septum initiation protein DivIVA